MRLLTGIIVALSILVAVGLVRGITYAFTQATSGAPKAELQVDRR